MYCRECGKQIDPIARFCKYCGSPQTTTDNSQTSLSSSQPNLNNSQPNLRNPPPNWGNPPPNWGNPPPNWGSPPSNWGNPPPNWGNPPPKTRTPRSIIDHNFHNPKRGKIIIILGAILLILGTVSLVLFIVEMSQYPIGTRINLNQPFTYLIIGGILILTLGKILHWMWND